jgi:RimJ/RimL family protein N-acetyltransferase
VIAADVFRDQPTLVGKRVRLEPLTEAVFEGVWSMLQDPEGRRLTGTHAGFAPDEVREWLASRGDQHDRADWAAMRIEDGAFLGEAVILDFDPANETAGYRVALSHPQLYGQAYGTEITGLVVDYALDTVGLYRLGLEVFDFNTRAMRVYEKCGFRVEGIRRGALLWDGERHDAVLMSIRRGDPRTP